MKKYQIFAAVVAFSMFTTACKEQLDVQNPNQPTVNSANTEFGIVALASGAVYANGFRDLKHSDGVIGTFWTGAVGFHEIMGDVVGMEAANVYANQIGLPEEVVLDNGAKVPNPTSPKTQRELLRQVNLNSQRGNNPLFYEWAYMYSLNNGCNNILSLADEVSFAGDAATKKGVLQAWAYWWKGFAYSRIGSIYYAGLINDEASKTNGNYKTKEQIIAEANNNFTKAENVLKGLQVNAAYNEVLGKLIPSFCQVGKGGLLTPDMWIRNINTMRARNILVNTPAKTMSSAQWAEILTLTTNGVRANDLVFTGRANTNGDFISPRNGTMAAKSTGNPLAGFNTYKISERLVQEFKAGDKRFANNFEQLSRAWIGNGDRGNSFNTRWQLLDGGKGMAGVVTLSSLTAGNYELLLAGSYEENELMKAEALINTGNVSGGTAIIDAIRNLQGAGLPAISGATRDVALEELRRERRVALVFRGLSFYDARRWDVINEGRKGAVVVDGSGKVNTNATINYRFMDYWDVPDNELAYNPPATGSAAVKNPK
jgi:hypothetical protein